MEGSSCDLCKKNGLDSKIIARYLNYEEVILVCEIEQCPWPIGVHNYFTIIKRNFTESFVPKKKKKRRTKVTTTPECPQSIQISTELSLYTPPVTPSGDNKVKDPSQENSIDSRLEDIFNESTDIELASVKGNSIQYLKSTDDSYAPGGNALSPKSTIATAINLIKSENQKCQRLKNSDDILRSIFDPDDTERSLTSKISLNKNQLTKIPQQNGNIQLARNQSIDTKPKINIISTEIYPDPTKLPKTLVVFKEKVINGIAKANDNSTCVSGAESSPKKRKISLDDEICNINDHEASSDGILQMNDNPELSNDTSDVNNSKISTLPMQLAESSLSNNKIEVPSNPIDLQTISEDLNVDKLLDDIMIDSSHEQPWDSTEAMDDDWIQSLLM